MYIQRTTLESEATPNESDPDPGERVHSPVRALLFPVTSPALSATNTLRCVLIASHHDGWQSLLVSIPSLLSICQFDACILGA